MGVSAFGIVAISLLADLKYFCSIYVDTVGSSLLFETVYECDVTERVRFLELGYCMRCGLILSQCSVTTYSFLCSISRTRSPASSVSTSCLPTKRTQSPSISL